MIKLEEITGYLPYGLKVMHLGVVYPVDGMRAIYIILNDHGDTMSAYYDSIKPILRPLSDLTKEIEINGEKFVPLVELARIQYPQFGLKNKFWYEDYPNFCSVCDYTAMNTRVWKKSIGHNEFRFIQKLYQWHFDIFGLIDRGDAIDINTLK
jgi:hypothetical protein